MLFRSMMGTRVSLSVGLIASVLVLIIGATYGAVSAFAGGSYVKTETYNTTKSYGYQVGLKGQLPLAARWQGFASVGVGDDVNTYEVGVGYDITPNWDAHIKYRSSSVDVDNYDDDVKGWQVGMGYKF